MAKKYKSLLTNAKPVYSKDTQLAQLMYQVRDNKNLPSNAPKQIKPFTPQPKKEQPQAKGILADAFDTDENYLQKFKRGNIGGGVANLAGSTLTAGQTLLSNIANNVSSLSTGQGLQPYRAQMDNAALEQAIYKRTGAVPISEKISKTNPALGTAYRVAMDIASDPIELTPFGFLNDIKIAKGAAQNTQAYGEMLKAGKLPGYGVASGIKTAEPLKAKAVQPTFSQNNRPNWITYKANSQPKLLTEGVNWTPGKAPTRAFVPTAKDDVMSQIAVQIGETPKPYYAPGLHSTWLENKVNTLAKQLDDIDKMTDVEWEAYAKENNLGSYVNEPIKPNQEPPLVFKQTVAEQTARPLKAALKPSPAQGLKDRT